MCPGGGEGRGQLRDACSLRRQSRCNRVASRPAHQQWRSAVLPGNRADTPEALAYVSSNLGNRYLQSSRFFGKVVTVITDFVDRPGNEVWRDAGTEEPLSQRQ